MRGARTVESERGKMSDRDRQKVRGNEGVQRVELNELVEFSRDYIYAGVRSIVVFSVAVVGPFDGRFL